MTFTKAFNQSNGGETSRERKEMEKELATAENRVKNVTGALGKIGFSEALAAQLAVEEKRVSDVKTRLAQAGARTPKVLPHPRRIESYVRSLLAVLEADKDAARALLARHMPPLVLTPEASSYRITGGFDLSLCLDDTGAPDPQGVRGASESMIGRVAGACYRIIQRPHVYQWYSQFPRDPPDSPQRHLGVLTFQHHGPPGKVPATKPRRGRGRVERDPSHPVHARVDNLEVELRVVADDVTTARATTSWAEPVPGRASPPTTCSGFYGKPARAKTATRAGREELAPRHEHAGLRDQSPGRRAGPDQRDGTEGPVVYQHNCSF